MVAFLPELCEWTVENGHLGYWQVRSGSDGSWNLMLIKEGSKEKNGQNVKEL